MKKWLQVASGETFIAKKIFQVIEVPREFSKAFWSFREVKKQLTTREPEAKPHLQTSLSVASGVEK